MTNLKVKLRVGAGEKHENDLCSPNKQVITLSTLAYDIPLACKMVGLAQFVYSVATGGVPDSISSCFRRASFCSSNDILSYEIKKVREERA